MVSYLTIIYGVIAGMALTLGGVHLVIWGGRPRHRAYLFSAGMALAASAGAVVELAIARTGHPEPMGELLRWGNLTVAITLLCMVWFVQTYLMTGRRWVLWSITGLWAGGLIINFVSSTGLTFHEIQAVRQLETFWGESYYQVVGATNPWKFMADLASLLIMIFVVDASRTAWRQGRRHSAAVIGGSITFFIVVAGTHTPLVDAGLMRTPSIISGAFVAILAAMSYEMARDVSRSRSLFEEVRTGQERWLSLLETVQLLVLDIDAEGRIRYANPFFLDLRGVRPDDVLGHPATDFLMPEVGEDLFEDLRHGRDPDTPREAQIEVQGRDGETHRVAMTTLRLVDKTDDFAGLLCVGADITRELATGRALTQTRLHLDRLMRSNLLGEFASSLAHELNQPLAAILANAQVAQNYLRQEPPALDDVREVLDDIVQDDRRAADLIAQLRNLVHKDNPSRESLDLSQVLTETLALLQRELSNHQITLKLECPPSVVPIEACRVEIQQVLLNLLLNAIQVLADVPIVDRVINVHVAEQADAVQVSISDTGPGLPAEKEEEVFEAFNTGRNGNIGMGLTICRRIIEAHGGLIRAANNPAGGAVFTLTLPLQSPEGHEHESTG